MREALSHMWKERTAAEIAAAQRRQRRSRLRTSAIFGVLIMLLATCLHGGPEAVRDGRFVVPRDELLSRLPFGVFAGSLCAIVVYMLGRKRPMMICPQCGAAKYEDGLSRCACGGHFEKQEAIRYVH